MTLLAHEEAQVSSFEEAALHHVAAVWENEKCGFPYDSNLDCVFSLAFAPPLAYPPDFSFMLLHWYFCRPSVAVDWNRMLNHLLKRPHYTKKVIFSDTITFPHLLTEGHRLKKYRKGSKGQDQPVKGKLFYNFFYFYGIKNAPVSFTISIRNTCWMYSLMSVYKYTYKTSKILFSDRVFGWVFLLKARPYFS